MNAAVPGNSADLPPRRISAGADDRRYPRFHGNLPAIKINDIGATWQGFLASIVDVSERGLCLRIPFVLAMGNSFNFEITLPDGSQVTGTAQCRWTRAESLWISWMCGSEIIGVNPADAERWEIFIRDLERSAPRA